MTEHGPEPCPDSMHTHGGHDEQPGNDDRSGHDEHSDHSGQGHEHGVPADADLRYLLGALGLITAFMAGEVVAAIVGGSWALLADAGHMLTDVAALGASAWAARLATRPADHAWTFGLQRAEILAAAVNGVTLAAISLLVSVEGIRRLIAPPPVDGPVVLVVALTGVAVNIAATAVLARANRSSLNVRGAFAHIVTDLYAFTGAAAAGLTIWLTGWNRADAAASLLVATLMARTAWPLLRESGRILLQATPDHVDLADVRSHLTGAKHVLDVHDLHAWTVTSGRPTVSAHVVVEEHCFATGHAPQLLDTVQHCLTGCFALEHATVQLEPASHADHEHTAHP